MAYRIGGYSQWWVLCITVGFWFFLGSLLGKFIDNLWVAVGIWLAIQIIIVISLLPFLTVQ